MPTATPTAAELNAGQLNHRLEAAIPAGIDAAITEVAKELAGGKNPRNFRSKAARLLLTEGAIAVATRRAREQAKTGKSK